MTTRSVALLTGCVLLVSVATLSLGVVEAAAPAEDAAVERTRQTTRMLDELYKTAVVLITKHYVESIPTCRPAPPPSPV